MGRIKTYTTVVTKQLNKVVSSRYYYFVLATIAAALTWLNWQNQMMGGIVWYYEDFADFIASGFSSDYAFKSGTPSFPMWGYGFVIFLLQSKALIIIVQVLFSLFTIYTIVKTLLKLNFSEEQIHVFKVFLLFSFSWFLFHSGYWPYSFGANLLVLSMLFLLRGIQEGKTRLYMFSALLYGVVLNFRSDYLYYFYFLIPALLILFILQKKRKLLIPLMLWGAVVFLSLVPWAKHTYSTTGKVQLYSSNGGHHLFISLGQLPNNVWGITADDRDPIMREIVNKKLGSEYRTVGHQADPILRNEWKKRVFNNPIEFLKKCGFNLYSLFTRPFTHGEIYRKYIQNESEIILLKNALKSDIQSFNMSSLFKKMTSKAYLGFVISILINICSIILFLVLLVYFVKGLVQFKSRILKDPLLFVCYTIILYQIALQTLVYYLPNYHTNVLLFYIIIAISVHFEAKPKTDRILSL